MSHNLTTGIKKWQLIGKQKTKPDIQTQKIQEKKNQNDLNIQKQNVRDMYDINIDKLTSMQHQIPLNIDKAQSIQIGNINPQSVQQKGMIYESQQLPSDLYGIYNAMPSQNYLQTTSNNRSQIIQSISFHEDTKKYQDSSLIHELENMKDSNAQINLKVDKKQNQIHQIISNKKQSKTQKILNNVKKMALSLDLLKNTHKNILLQISMYQSTSVNSSSLFIKNHQLQDYLITQLKEILINNNKRNSNNFLMSKSRQTLNQSFMKGLNESMQILQTSQKELKSGKLIQKLMKSLEQSQKLTVQLRKKLTLKELDNKKLLKEVSSLREKNIELISQKQQLLEQIFTLQQQIVGVQLQIQQKVKKVMSDIQPNYQLKKQKSIENNINVQVYLSTIQQLSNQITILNQKCSNYQKFIIEKQTINDFHSKQGYEQIKKKIQKQLQAKQRYLTDSQRQLSFKDKKIKDYQMQLKSFARQIDQQKQFVVEKQQQLNQYNLELNERQEGLYNWQKSLEEQDSTLNKNIAEFKRQKHLYDKQVSYNNKNVNFSPEFGERPLKKIDSCPRQTPVFQRRSEQNREQLDLDLKRIQQRQSNYKNFYKNISPGLNYEPKSSNEHKKSISSYSRGGNVILIDNQDNCSAYYENQYENERQKNKRYQNYLNRNNKVLLRHKNIVQNKEKLYSNLYSSNVEDKKSVLVDDILARRRKEINKLVDNKRYSKNNLLTQGIFTQSEINRIKSPVHQNYKISNYNRSSFNLSNYNQEKQKFQSRKVYETSQRNYQQKPKVNKFSKDISCILNKTNTNYEKDNYKKYDKKESGLDNINEKLEKLKQEIKKQVKALQ